MEARPNRRSIRMQGYDYSRSGAYFVSICTKDRKCLFGDIDNQEMALNDAGRMVDKWYVELENKFKDIRGVKQYGWVPFPARLWQRNYYEHIVRNGDDMSRIREYIRKNPAQWATDKDNPSFEDKDSCP